MSRASILLVEDEALIRMMLADMIEELGHRVVAEAGNIEAGKALAETAVYDVAILDLNIAGRNVGPVAEIVNKRGLPFVFVSGYGSGGQPEAFRGQPVLEKPVSAARLGQTIDAVLSR